MKVFEVDSISYLNALSTNKQLLMEESQIPALQKALQVAAISFKENIINERASIKTIKKEALLNEVNQYELELQKRLNEYTENTISTNTIKELLFKVKSFNEEAKNLLNPDTIIDELKIDTNGYVFVEQDIVSDADYKSEYSAESAAVNFIRNIILPGAEREYINCRREIIANYCRILMVRKAK